jgi:sirohydrochlorin ferrochelatase
LTKEFIEMKTAILLMGHGSRVPEANDVLHTVAEMVHAGTGFDIVEVAFREKHPPDIQEGIDRCIARGAERILLYPYFLYAGAHVLEDLPDEMEKAARRHPRLKMVLGKPLGVHPKLGEIVSERVAETLAEAGWYNSQGKTAFLCEI